MPDSRTFNGYPWLLCSNCQKLYEAPDLLKPVEVNGRLTCKQCGKEVEVVSILYMGAAEMSRLHTDVATAGGQFYHA